MSKRCTCQPVSIGEIAELLKVPRKTVQVWRQRAVLPSPDFGIVSSIPLWRRETIVEWAADTGRLPEGAPV